MKLGGVRISVQNMHYASGAYLEDRLCSEWEWSSGLIQLDPEERNVVSGCVEKLDVTQKASVVKDRKGKFW